MDNKEFFIKEKELKLRDLENKIDKEELKTLKKKQELDNYISNLKKKKEEFAAALEMLKQTENENWDEAEKEFSENFVDETFATEVDEKFKEITEKTKGFLNDLSTKVTDFYNKNVDKPGKDDAEM